MAERYSDGPVGIDMFGPPIVMAGRSPSGVTSFGGIGCDWPS